MRLVSLLVLTTLGIIVCAQVRRRQHAPEASGLMLCGNILCEHEIQAKLPAGYVPDGSEKVHLGKGCSGRATGRKKGLCQVLRESHSDEGEINMLVARGGESANVFMIANANVYSNQGLKASSAPNGEKFDLVACTLNRNRISDCSPLTNDEIQTTPMVTTPMVTGALPLARRRLPQSRVSNFDEVLHGLLLEGGIIADASMDSADVEKLVESEHAINSLKSTIDNDIQEARIHEQMAQQDIEQAKVLDGVLQKEQREAALMKVKLQAHQHTLDDDDDMQSDESIEADVDMTHCVHMVQKLMSDKYCGLETAEEGASPVTWKSACDTKCEEFFHQILVAGCYKMIRQTAEKNKNHIHLVEKIFNSLDDTIHKCVKV